MNQNSNDNNNNNSDDSKEDTVVENPWTVVFGECFKNNAELAHQKVAQCQQWNISFDCMHHANSQDRKAFCEELGLDEGQSKKFKTSLRHCLITFSKFSFVLRITSEENRKNAESIVKRLNEFEKPMQRITHKDIEQICVECELPSQSHTISSLLSWYNVLLPLQTQQLLNRSFAQFLQLIALISTKFNLPFAAMEECNPKDISQLCEEMFGIQDDAFIEAFTANMEHRLRVLRVMRSEK